MRRQVTDQQTALVFVEETATHGGGCSPTNIVAFTFTDKATAELKERIHDRCRDAFGEVTGLAEMYVGTIHGFCLVNEVLASKYVKRRRSDYTTRKRLEPTPKSSVANVALSFSDVKYFFECPYQFKLRILYGSTRLWMRR